MSFADKMSNKAQEMRGRIKRNAGQVTGDRRLEAEGRAEERSGNLRQAGEKIKEALLGSARGAAPGTERTIPAPDRGPGGRRPDRRLPLAVVIAVVAGCAPSPGAKPGPTTAGPTAVAAPAPALAPAAPLRVLQLNLCSSGIAGCYTGRSTDQAAAVVRAEAPDLVTLNEVCQDDVADLERALADAVPDATVVSAFQPARNGRNGEPYRCRNGRQYGIGLVSRWPSVPGAAASGGIYPAQDREDPEERAWLAWTPPPPHPSRSAPRTWPTRSGGRGRPVPVPLRDRDRGDPRPGRDGTRGAGR